ncbi:PqqD family protein [Wenzhouxiangella sp. XN79A]|uniref:PqqD family protein n=1 Tax=Wenzhouxiangella sp. XN79A TaxID=2724193 RepID=UPI00144A6948|nr:PqqD family protein [Wenzhouxiangella sp. XN79A]NKI33601.1 PqqD family protein [Wenzhouxiangella sp. XN79A]
MSDAIQQIRAALDSGRLTVNRMDDGTAVVLDIEGEQLMTLNGSAVTLLDAISSRADSEKALAEALVDAYEVDIERAERDASDFLTALDRSLSRD